MATASTKAKSGPNSTAKPKRLTAAMKDRVSVELREMLVPIGTLRLDPANVRKHTDESVAAIAESLRAYGQVTPIVAGDDGTVIKGNGTLQAARLLDWSHIAMVRFRGDDAAGYAIVDNRTGELSSWHEELLADVLQTTEFAVDIDVMFDAGYVDQLLASVSGIDGQSDLAPEGGGDDPADRESGAAPPSTTIRHYRVEVECHGKAARDRLVKKLGDDLDPKKYTVRPVDH